MRLPRGLGLHRAWAGARPHICHCRATPLASDPATPVGSLESTKHAFCLPWPLLCPTAHGSTWWAPSKYMLPRGCHLPPLSVRGSVSPLASLSYGAQTVPTDIWSLHLLYQHVLCFKFVEKMSLLKNVLGEPPTPPPDLAAAFLPSGLQVLLPADTPAVPSAQKACLGSLPPSAIL